MKPILRAIVLDLRLDTAFQWRAIIFTRLNDETPRGETHYSYSDGTFYSESVLSKILQKTVGEF